MKIGISCFPGHGGSGVVAAELGKALAARGHEVHFVTREQPFRIEELTENLYFHPVTPMPYPVFTSAPYTLALATRLADIADKHDLDVIHAHYAIPHSTAAYLARMSSDRDLRVVTTLHGTDTRLVGLDPSYWRMVRFSIEQSDAVTAVSRDLAEQSASDFRLTRPVEVIHNFIDTHRFRPGVCPHLRAMIAADDELICCHVSNLRPVKRVADIVRAHARVTAATGARLVVVGNGPDRDEAERLAGELGVAGRISFLGTRDDVAPYLAAADVFVMASEQESFGVAALEAMACGVPVVAPRIGGLQELVDDGITGELTPPGDIEALATAQIGLLRDGVRRRAWGEAARARAVSEFATEIIMPRYTELYERVLAAAPVSA